MLQITINASVRPVFYSGRYATGNIPTNHPCLATFYGSSRFGGWHHFFKLAFPPLTLTSLVLPVSLNLLNRPTDGATVYAAFLGFVVNLLNRPTDGTTVHALKSTSEKELLLLRMGVRKITFFTKGA
jgi:hypothetical protein